MERRRRPCRPHGHPLHGRHVRQSQILPSRPPQESFVRLYATNGLTLMNCGPGSASAIFRRRMLFYCLRIYGSATVRSWNPSLGAFAKNKKAVAGLRTSATASYTGMIRNPRSNLPASPEQSVSRMGLTSLEARCSKVTAGSQLGIAPPFDLSEGGRIIRGLDRRSTCGTPFLPKLRPPGRRALFSVATRLHRCRL